MFNDDFSLELFEGNSTLVPSPLPFWLKERLLLERCSRARRVSLLCFLPSLSRGLMAQRLVGGAGRMGSDHSWSASSIS